MNPPLKKIDDIEFLRGFAMLLVLTGHAHRLLLTWTTPTIERLYYYLHGATGVDLFFAISGFVIARDLHPKLAACKNFRPFLHISLAFWIRRMWRILPSAWLWLGVILLATIFFNKSGIFRSFDAALDGTIAAVFQYYNYRFALCFKHYECGANFYYWTLSLEEQFYLLLPLVILLSRKWLPYLLSGVILFQMFFPHRPPMMSIFRTDALLLGVMIALWSRKKSYESFRLHILERRWLRRIAIAGLFLVMLTDARLNAGPLGDFSYGVIAVICAGLVLIGSYDANYLIASGVVKKFLMWLGSRSCSMYLVHIPAYFGTQEIWYRIAPHGITPDQRLPFILTGSALVLVLSELSYRFVEVPSRRKGSEVSKRFLERRAIQSVVGHA